MERKDKQKAEKFSVRTDLAIEAREMVREGREEAGSLTVCRWKPNIRKTMNSPVSIF